MKNEKVSVYIPTRNRAKLLARALDSLISQETTPDEVIVINDASTDCTGEILADYSRRYAWIKYESNLKPMGACYSRNVALRMSTSKYITGLDDDDQFSKGRITQFLSQKEGLGEKYSGIASRLIVRDKRGDRLSGSTYPLISAREIRRKNYVGNQIFTLTESMLALGGFDPAMPALQDWDLWMRMIHKLGPIRVIDSPTYIVRQDHSGERITNASNRSRAVHIFFYKHRKEYPKGERLIPAIWKKVFERKRPSLSEFFFAMRHDLMKESIGAWLRGSRVASRIRKAINRDWRKLP